MGAGKRNRDGQGIAADPKGLPVGEGFESADKPVTCPFRRGILAGGVIQDGPQAEFVKTAAKNTPGPAYQNGPQHRNQTAPEKNQGGDY
jgi:hypothetical protein